MRGKALCELRHRKCAGITPAYAGKRYPHTCCHIHSKDHPRLCGEKTDAISLILSHKGSPPPMRGKDDLRLLYSSCPRITPAYAGKRKTKAGYHTVTRDHPRLCGEKRVHPPEDFRQMGSPPPMRGKVYFVAVLCRAFGITPAYAGKSANVVSFLYHHRDHPRLCGEKSGDGAGGVKWRGSPPPMRGKVSDDLRRNIRIGITPAYAGKSTNCFQICGFREDHPRLCGEKGKWRFR